MRHCGAIYTRALREIGRLLEENSSRRSICVILTRESHGEPAQDRCVYKAGLEKEVMRSLLCVKD